MRNIVLIVIDTLRADHLGHYGYPRPTSPFLDRLAERSLVLDACYSASNYTAPAFTSIFTASYPSRHGIFDFHSQAGSSPIRTLLAGAGMRAEGVVTFRFFKNLLGRIWGDIEAVTDGRSFDYAKDLPKAVSDGAIEWLEKHGRQGPFCLFLHYDGPHVPYRLPKPYAEQFDTVNSQDVDPDFLSCFYPQHLERIGGAAPGDPTIPRLHQIIGDINRHRRTVDPPTRRFLVDKYDASIRYTDDMVARVYEALEGLGLLSDTVVGVFSDHGEELFDHGHFGHGEVHIYEEIIRTLGLIHDPARSAIGRSSVPLSHVQILPTLLALAGITLPPELSGLDMRETIHRKLAGGLPQPVFCIGTFKSVVRREQLKWIHTRISGHLSLHRRAWQLLRLLRVGQLGDELYDLASDPAEQVNLAKRRNLRRPLAALLREHFRQNAGPSLIAGTKEDLDEAERARIEKELKDLGYM